MADAQLLINLPAPDDIALKSGLLSEYVNRGHPGATPAEMFDTVFDTNMRRERVTVPLTAGRYPWSYKTPYPAGAAPIVQVTVETPDDATYTLDAKVLAGSVTNTGATIVVTKINATQTLGATLAALLGAVINIFSPATGTVTVHCSAGLP